MDIAIITTNPTSIDKIWSKTNKPRIAIIISGTRLTSQLSLQVIFETQTTCSTTINNVAEHIYHLMSTLFADNLVHTWLELSNHISFIILDSCNKHTSSTYTMINKSGISTCHLTYTDVAGTETEGGAGEDVGIVEAVVAQDLQEVARTQHVLNKIKSAASKLSVRV